MAGMEVLRPTGGFDFSNTKRTEMLQKKLDIQEKFQVRKTGTTICGIVFDGGVMLGADTRATEGPIVADPNCLKIHKLAANIYACGAGTAADCDHVTALMESQLELHRLATGREVRVVTAVTMLARRLFQYQGHIGTALVIGGIDCTGPSLYTIYPHGSVDRLPFVTMGSGSLAAMAMFEHGYKENLNAEEAQKLVRAAITSGITNDLGSGSNVDCCCIQKGKVEMYRNIDPAAPKWKTPTGFPFSRGTTAVLQQNIKEIRKNIDVADAMDTA
jgi:20S proteasome subunit beta 2